MLAQTQQFRLASRESQLEATEIRVGGAVFGPGRFTVIAGPCAVESEEQVIGAAKAVKEAGAGVFRASAFKPRTSPYSFQGLGRKGLKLLEWAGKEAGIPTETEVMDPRDVKFASRHADILRVGSRNMHNFDLLKEMGKVESPVILKRGLSATVEELLCAAEYILHAGNPKVILCERGIRTFEPATRFTLDLTVVPVLKQLTHLPVIVDPSHAAGKRKNVGPLCRAALAVGADGLLVEVHPEPEKALSDAEQQLGFAEFGELMRELKGLAPHFGRSLG